MCFWKGVVVQVVTTSSTIVSNISCSYVLVLLSANTQLSVLVEYILKWLTGHVVGSLCHCKVHV